VDRLKVAQHLVELPMVAILDEAASRRKVLAVNLVVGVVVGIAQVAA
jgi:hypothetical protein